MIKDICVMIVVNSFDLISDPKIHSPLYEIALPMQYQIYHNFMRPYEDIANMIPVEKRGIKIDGENK